MPIKNILSKNEANQYKNEISEVYLRLTIAADT